MTTPTQLSFYQRSLLVLLFGMVAGSLLTDYLLLPTQQPGTSLLISAIKWLPLLLLSPLLKKGDANSYIWFAYLLIPYFCWSVLKGFAPALVGWIGVIESLLLVMLFTLAISCARFKKQLQ
jgi:uncharacterized membrane protein